MSERTKVTANMMIHPVDGKKTIVRALVAGRVGLADLRFNQFDAPKEKTFLRKVVIFPLPRENARQSRTHLWTVKERFCIVWHDTNGIDSDVLTSLLWALRLTLEYLDVAWCGSHPKFFLLHGPSCFERKATDGFLRMEYTGDIKRLSSD